MNNKIIIGGIVLFVLVGGGLLIVNQNSQQSEQAKMEQEKVAMVQREDPFATKTPEQIAMEKADESKMMEKDTNKMMKSNSSRYVEYSKTVLDQSADKRRVLYFYATWCPSCKAANEDFTANPNKIPEDVVVIRTNYNDPDTDLEEKDLAKKYGITYQHTFVQIDGQGKQITKWNGGDTDELVANIK